MLHQDPNTGLMSYPNWVALPDHPLQRPTKRHALYALKRHLKTPEDQHHMVQAVKHPTTGKLFKLDGHTRTWIWENDYHPRPHRLRVTVYNALDEQDFQDCYYRVNSSSESKTSVDNINSAFEFHGLVVTGAKFKSGQVSSALRPLVNAKTIRGKDWIDVVGEWLDEIEIVDKIPFQRRVRNGIITAAILSIRRYGDAILPFWNQVANEDGYKQGKTRCPAQMAQEIIMRLHGVSGGSGQDNTLILALLPCADKFIKGGNYHIKSVPHPAPSIAGYRNNATKNKRARQTQAPNGVKVTGQVRPMPFSSDLSSEVLDSLLSP